MKRKLDENSEPNTEASGNGKVTQQKSSFENFGFDPRLLQAIVKLQYTSPTPVQAKTIPLALEGKDVFARSGTGSGKTAAYVLPAIQSILKQKAAFPKSKTTKTLILVPTRELADQVHKVFLSLITFCSKDVRSTNISQRASDAVIRALLQDSPDIIISTPGRASQFLSSGHLSLDGITMLVIDEADLVLSYGYEDDIKVVSEALPHGIQTFLMSATLTSEVESLKDLFCRDPATVAIEDDEEKVQEIKQYAVNCAEDEKFLLIFVIFKLKLITGKCIVFVANLDRSYRLKLYLEQFGIRSCVLNSELPVNTRLHSIEEFNKGLYQILIAADDHEVLGGIHKDSTSTPAKGGLVEDQTLDDPSDQDDLGPSRKKQMTNKHKEYGVSRGIDFQNVACVVNFDLPSSSKSYTHRIGRTARAGKTGMALSFVIPKDSFGKHKPTSIKSARHDEKILEKIKTRQAKKGKEIEPYQFDMTQIESFRYRMNDALRAVTKTAVHEARAREIKQELIKSEKLRKHFEENPADLRHLRHDGGHGAVVRVQPHLKHIPDYLLPAKGRKALTTTEDVGFVGFKKREEDRNNKKRRGRGKRASFGKPRGGRTDPLKSFRAK